MEKRQVLLVGMLPLLGEGLRRIFQKMEDVELICLDGAQIAEIEVCLSSLHPQMVVLAGEKEDDAATHLISRMLKQYDDIPVAWVDLETNALRLYIAHRMPASSSDLINAIRQHQPCQEELSQMEIYLLAKKKRSRNKRR